MLANPFITQSPVSPHVARFRVVDDETRDKTKSKWLKPQQLHEQYYSKDDNIHGESNDDGSDADGD